MNLELLNGINTFDISSLLTSGTYSSIHYLLFLCFSFNDQKSLKGVGGSIPRLRSTVTCSKYFDAALLLTLLTSGKQAMFSGSLRSTGKNVCKNKALSSRQVSNAGKRTHLPKKSKSDVQVLTSAANMLIKGTKNAQTDPDWKHTDGKKGERARLAAEVARKNLVQRKEMVENEPGEFGSVDEVLNIPATETLMKPGTFFELRR